MAKADPGRAWPGWATAFAGLAILAVLSLRMVAPFQVLVGIKTAFQAVAVAYVAWHCPFSRAERDRLVSILMGAGAATAAWGLVQQGSDTGPSATWATGTARPSGSAVTSSGRSPPSSSRSRSPSSS